MQSKLIDIFFRNSPGYYALPYYINWFFPYESVARHVVEFTVVYVYFIRLPYTFFSVNLQHVIDIGVFIIHKLLNIDDFEPFLLYRLQLHLSFK